MTDHLALYLSNLRSLTAPYLVSTQYIIEASVSRNNKKGNIRITNSLRNLAVVTTRVQFLLCFGVALRVAGASEATQPFFTLPNDARAEP